MILIQLLSTIFLTSSLAITTCGHEKDYVGISRHYCIGAVEIVWDYGWNSSNTKADLTGDSRLDC
jgi:hypothetical protein